MFNLLFKTIKTDKAKYYILLFSFMIFVINIIALIINSTERKVDIQIINKIENRAMYVISNDGTDKSKLIKSLPNVQDVSYNTGSFYAKCNKFDKCSFKFINPLIKLNLVKGKINNLGYNEAIVSEKFLSKNNKNIEDVINKKIKVIIENQSIELTIVGVYSNTGSDNYYIYISNDNNINKLIKNSNRYIVLINNRSSYKKVEKKLKDNDCSIEFIDDSYQNEVQTYKDINNILRGFFLLCYITLLLMFLFLLFSNIAEKSYSIALLKTFGYSNIFILILILSYFIFILLFSLIISTITIGFINLLFISLLDIKNLFDFIIIMKNFFAILLMLVLVVTLIYIKIKRITIIKMIKDS